MALIFFSAEFIKIISHYKKIGYNIDVKQQTACLVVGSVQSRLVTLLSSLIARPVGRATGTVAVAAVDLFVGGMVGAWYFCCCQAHLGLPVGFLLLRCSGLFTVPYLCFVSFLCLGLCVLGDDALIGWGSFVRHLCVLIHI